VKSIFSILADLKKSEVELPLELYSFCVDEKLWSTMPSHWHRYELWTGAVWFGFWLSSAYLYVFLPDSYLKWPIMS